MINNLPQRTQRQRQGLKELNADKEKSEKEIPGNTLFNFPACADKVFLAIPWSSLRYDFYVKDYIL